jgi:hypothetical protein
MVETVLSEQWSVIVRSSLKTGLLPATLYDAGDLSLVRQRTEAQAADAELAQESARTTAELAAVVLAA